MTQSKLKRTTKKTISYGLTSASTLFQMTKRNILLFLKNRATVFFAFVAPILIFVFYLLFLGDMQINAIKDLLIKDGVDISALGNKEITNVANSWMIAGIVSIACLTVGLNSMLVIIQDKETKVINDFTASPLKPITLLLSYAISAFILTFTLCLLVLIAGIVFLSISSGVMFSAAEVFELILILFLSCFSSVMIMLCIMSNFNTNAASSAFTGVFCALIGFLIGAYLPSGMMPKGIMNFANIIPGSHATSLFRNVFINKAFTTIPAEYLASMANVKTIYFDMAFFGYEIPIPFMYLYLTGSIILFFSIYATMNAIKNKRKK